MSAMLEPAKVIVPGERFPKYDLEKANAIRNRTLKPQFVEAEQRKKGQTAESSFMGQPLPHLSEVRTQVEMTKLRKMLIEINEIQGLLVDKQETENFVRAAGQLLKDGLMQTIPRRAPVLATMRDTHEISVMLEEDYTKIFRQLEEKIRQLGG